jgi:hypothetical protein
MSDLGEDLFLETHQRFDLLPLRRTRYFLHDAIPSSIRQFGQDRVLREIQILPS